ncbi:hypothetical protein QBC44DRAFT_374615 [Cladorrhinum sp. PSN332]|nr:hypothetical protein QBC44DRAFT_374615 [Cladorrhinum sp. PSN332]
MTSSPTPTPSSPSFHSHHQQQQQQQPPPQNPQPATPFILRQIIPSDLQSLCRALWDWPICAACTSNPSSPSTRCYTECPWSLRSNRLEPFFNWYKKTTSSYAPDLFGDECQALRNHGDLHDIITALRAKTPARGSAHASTTTAAAAAAAAEQRRGAVPESDKRRAIKLAMKIMSMSDVYGATTCHTASIRDDTCGFVVVGALSDEEKLIESTTESWMDSFRASKHPALEYDSVQGRKIKAGLSVDKLVGVGGLRIKAADELQNHLKLDQERGEFLVFGWTVVLKEGLLATLAREKGRECTPREDRLEENVMMRRDGECIPRALALETLHTIAILFPPSNPAAQKILRSLVDRQILPDPDITRFGTSSYEASPAERDRALQFPIWGSRLLDLYDEVENPRPRGRMESWLERRSKSRHVMMATIAGVGAAVVLGVLGLGVAIFQTWISWQQLQLESARGDIAESG